MKISSLAEIKKELHHLPDKELITLITDVCKFSSDNKLFIFFQLFGREHPGFFLEWVREELSRDFQNANTSNYLYAKKSAQRIRRKLNKFLKYSKDKPTQIELIAFFCDKLFENGYLSFHHPVINNLYNLQVGKAEKILGKMHEDLQYDFQDKVRELKEHMK